MPGYVIIPYNDVATLKVSTVMIMFWLLL
jgi:hypothetical protein